ncbi:MAG: T9SS type A sorting domain-containing protein [Flavipsychrobacter sp.]|nr:T9SS type A sorting domain-containing protein [Flavipsychrobacter sp.]
MFRSLLVAAFITIAATSARAQCPATVVPSSNPVCTNTSFTLTASSGANSYQWFLNGNSIPGSNNVLTTINPAPGNQLYTVIIDFGNCIDTVDVTMTIIATPIVTASNNNPIFGNTLILTATPCVGCTYSWTGPNNFSSTFQNPMIPNITCLGSGIYSVVVTSNGCASDPDTTQVSVNGGFTVSASNNGPVCAGDTLILTADTITNASYSWTGPGGFTSTQQNPVVVADNTTEGGIYTVVANVYNCLSSDTTHVTTCNTFFVSIYNDMNGNCINEVGTDYLMNGATLVEIDSNNVVLDTIPCTNGIYYTPTGNPGDVYTFKIVSLPLDFTPSCPQTGTINHVYQPQSFATLDMGVECATNNSFDLILNASNPVSSATAQTGYIYISNPFCMSTNATVTLQHSPKYTYYSANPPATVSGNTLTWNIQNLNNQDGAFQIYYYLVYATTPLLANDTTHSFFSVTPTTGDYNPANNTWTKVDTVVASQDPNAIMAFPEGCIDAGDQLQYTIMFENIGNAPAENIYVMDTLPQGLDASSMELVMSSHNMYVTKLYDNGNTIFRFDFPNINLPDSSDHAGCHGMLVYKINSDSNLPLGDSIDHRAGIYFDYNAVVMTNTYRTSICVPVNVSAATGTRNVLLYPNPADDALEIQSDEELSACTVTNSLGQIILTQTLHGTRDRLDISRLAPGVYQVHLEGREMPAVLKFVKL